MRCRILYGRGLGGRGGGWRVRGGGIRFEVSIRFVREVEGEGGEGRG